MDMTSFKSQFHHLSDLLEDADDIHWKQDGRLILILFAVTLLTGPLCLLGWWMQHWNSAPSWDTEDHWDATKRAATTFAVVDILLVIAFLYVHPSLAAFWYLILWYGFCALLAPTFALITERLDPRTIALERSQLPSEQPPSPTTAPTPPPPPPQNVTVEEQSPTPPGQPTRKKRSTTKKTAVPLTSKQELDKKLTKKRNKGRPVPMIDLLHQEQEERERKRTQINYVQTPLLPAEAESVHAPQEKTATPKTSSLGAPNSDAPSTPAPEPSSPQKRERRKPESLDNLF